VYLLCALTSLGCAVLVIRGYRTSHVRLLFWTALCFVGLAANNLILVLDFMVVPDVDLSLWRKLPAVAGVAALLYGLITDAR
jgi:hypothetical protein